VCNVENQFPGAEWAFNKEAWWLFFSTNSFAASLAGLLMLQYGMEEPAKSEIEQRHKLAIDRFPPHREERSSHADSGAKPRIRPHGSHRNKYPKEKGRGRHLNSVLGI